MNLPNAPKLVENAAHVGLTLDRNEADITESIDAKLMGIACVELLANLESLFARARRMRKADYIDEAAETARTMLLPLKQFCDEHLQGNGKQQTSEEIDKAVVVADTYDEVLKTRPLGNALLRAFWKADETEAIQKAHAKLATSLTRATAATMYHAILLIGADSNLAKEIDQSTVAFVNDLNQSW